MIMLTVHHFYLFTKARTDTLALSRIIHYIPLAKLNLQGYDSEKCVSALNLRDCCRIAVTQWIQN